MHAFILSLSSSGCTYLGIVLSCKLRELVLRPIRDLGFRFFFQLRCCSAYVHIHLYLLVYKGEGRGIGFIHFIIWVVGEEKSLNMSVNFLFSGPLNNDVLWVSNLFTRCYFFQFDVFWFLVKSNCSFDRDLIFLFS